MTASRTTSGQLQVTPPENFVGLRSAADIPGVVDHAREVTEQAIASGYAGVRVWVEFAVAVQAMPDVATQQKLQQAWEAFTLDHPMTMLCAYGPDLDGVPARDVVAVHPRGLADSMAFGTTEPDRVHLSGELDLSNEELFGHFLDVASRGDEALVVDLSRLSFVDVRTVARLVALSRKASRGLRFAGAPPVLRTIVDTLGWHGELEFVD